MSKYRQKPNHKKDQKYFSKTADSSHYKNKQNSCTNPQRGGIRL